MYQLNSDIGFIACSIVDCLINDSTFNVPCSIRDLIHKYKHMVKEYEEYEAYHASLEEELYMQEQYEEDCNAQYWEETKEAEEYYYNHTDEAYIEAMGLPWPANGYVL